MSSTPLGENAKRAKARRTLIAVFAVFAAPLIAAILAFNFWRPSTTSNYGELLTPRTLPALALSDLDGKAVTLESLRGKWLLVHVDSGACEASCRDKLYKLRQVRLAQGKHLDQVERVFFIIDAQAPAPDLLRTYEGTHFWRASDARAVMEALQAPDAQARIFIVDPIGQLMMRFPPEADPGKMLKDLKRLLKVSAPD
jgi:cytochrome oxidase Cu insertion factor (SCO1/SenC/PrrC family)